MPAVRKFKKYLRTNSRTQTIPRSSGLPRINRTKAVLSVFQKSARRWFTLGEVQEELLKDGLVITSDETNSICQILSGNNSALANARDELRRRGVRGSYQYNLNPQGNVRVRKGKSVMGHCNIDRVTNAVLITK